MSRPEHQIGVPDDFIVAFSGKQILQRISVLLCHQKRDWCDVPLLLVIPVIGTYIVVGSKRDQRNPCSTSHRHSCGCRVDPGNRDIFFACDQAGAHNDIAPGEDPRLIVPIPSRRNIRVCMGVGIVFKPEHQVACRQNRIQVFLDAVHIKRLLRVPLCKEVPECSCFGG